MNIEKRIKQIIDESISKGQDDLEAVLNAIVDLNISSSAELEKVLTVVLSRYIRDFNAFLFPENLVNFISKVFVDFEGKDILIPWSDIGLLPHKLESYKPNSITCITMNDHHGAFLKKLLKKVNSVTSDPLKWVNEANEKYDLVLGNMPFGLKKNEEYEHNGIIIKGDYAECLIAASLEKLKKGGKAIFVVAPSVLFNNPRTYTLKNNLQSLGASLNAVIDLPSGTWKPLTQISSHLIVIEKSEQKEVFSGLFSKDDKHHIQLAENYKNKNNGKTVSQGAWESYSDFKGYNLLDIQQRSERLALKANLSSKEMNEIIHSIEIIDTNKNQDFHVENSVYIPRAGFGKVVSSPDDIRDATKNLIQFTFKSNEVNAHYFSDFLNNSTLGQLFRNSVSSGTVIPNVSKSTLISSTVYLPDLDIQSSVINSLTRINELKNELKETESRIWETPNKIEEFDKKIDSINKVEGFIDWVDSLPFPLASILWSYHTQCNTEKEKYEKLLHFFEATTEFLTIIHLSVVDVYEDLFNGIRDELNAQLLKNKMHFEMATFGVWVTAFEILAKNIRKSLNSQDDRKAVLNAYGTQKFELLNKFLDKGFVGIFKQANLTRNTWQGHSGAVSESKAAEVHSSLKELLSKFRELSIGIWDYYQIVQPESTKFVKGVFQNEARNIMGTRTPFEKIEVITSNPIENGKLHLYSESSQIAIELLPFIKVMPSPKTESDACYFYNRLELKSGEARYISYHYEGDPEQLITSMALQTAIKKLSN